MTDTVVFITGPARGIGEALARKFASRGARVALVGLEPVRLAALAKELGPRHAWFECDVTDQAALERAVAGTVAQLGGIDVVITNAGIASHGTVAVAPADALARVIEVNLIGTLRTVSATLPHVVARKGSFMLISSAAAIATAPGLAAYSASKSGVEHFGTALRIEVAHRGVHVGVAHPSWIDTDLVRDAQQDVTSFARMLSKLPGPFGKITPLAECADAIVEGIVKRKRKVYVPKSLAIYSALRQLFMSAPVEALMRRDMRKSLDRMEAEVTALGRSFGAHSVEMTRPPGER
jgi:NAD(P)-dependent dehydrogenase (short-subunit alcohol dehydrogenase family)